MQSLQRNSVLLFSFLISLGLVGFGRPSDTGLFSYSAATLGYALFWQKLKVSSLSSRGQFFFLWLQFSLSSLLATRWLLSHPYSYIIVIWIFLSFFLSIPYAALIRNFLRSPFSLASLLQVSFLFSCFDLLETKIFFCGISFRSIGAFFMGNPLSDQLITLFGGIGLTFLVCLMNGGVLWIVKKQTSLLLGFLFLLVPLVSGALVYKSLPKPTFQNPLKVALFHGNTTALVDLQPQTIIQDYRETWKNLFSYANLLKNEKVDLILLPEGFVPYTSNSAILLKEELPKGVGECVSSKGPLVSSAEIAKGLAHFWNAPLIIGMERKDPRQKNAYYNSCFLFSPDTPFSFYDKQVLVPGGEYVPMEDFFKPLLLHYGISGSFKRGHGPGLLYTKGISLFPLICYEETLSQYVLPADDMKADLLIAISNDHWFPSPLFARDHWLLGKMRAMETGLSLLRSSNMGQSGCLLADGTTLISTKDPKKESLLIFSFTPEKRKTLFSFLKETGSLLFLFVITLGITIRKNKQDKIG